MTYENRLTLNYVFGKLSQAAAVSDVVLNSADFASRLPSGLSTSMYVPITLQDPSTGDYEIVWANAHAAGASTATVLRGREATTARAWANGTLWTVSPTARDVLLSVPNRAALPNDAHVGMRAYLQDEQLELRYAQGAGYISTYGITYRDNKVLASDSASVVFSNIPSTLKKVQVIWVTRSTVAAASEFLWMRINGDATNSYYANSASQGSTTPSYVVDGPATVASMGFLAGSLCYASTWSAGEVTFEGWNAPAGRAALNYQIRSNMFDTVATSGQHWNAGVFVKAGPYTSVTFLCPSSLKAGSEFTLYGWS